MPKFKIGGSYGYAGTDWEDEIETDDLQSAEDWARDEMMERISWYAEEIEDEIEEEIEEEDAEDGQS